MSPRELSRGWFQLFSVVPSDRTRSRAHKINHGKFHLSVRKNFILTMAELWKRLLEESVVTLPWQQGWTGWSPEVHSSPNNSVIETSGRSSGSPWLLPTSGAGPSCLDHLTVKQEQPPWAQRCWDPFQGGWESYWSSPSPQLVPQAQGTAWPAQLPPALEKRWCSFPAWTVGTEALPPPPQQGLWTHTLIAKDGRYSFSFHLGSVWLNK